MSNEYKTMTKEAYDKCAPMFAGTRSGKVSWGEFDLLKEYLPNHAINFLDLGCGSGRLFEYLYKQGVQLKKYQGVDFSKGLLREAENWNKEFIRKSSADVSFVEGDIESFIEEKQKYDVIALIASFHHLETEEKRKQLLANCYEMLTPEGTLFMTNWLIANTQKYEEDLVGDDDYLVSLGEDKSCKRYYHNFKEKELQKLLESFGYNEIRYVYTKKGVQSEAGEAWNIVTIAKR